MVTDSGEERWFVVARSTEARMSSMSIILSILFNYFGRDMSGGEGVVGGVGSLCCSW